MGQQYCCRERIKVPDLGEDLHISNHQLIEEIQGLREEHEKEIEESKVMALGETIYRGKVDPSKQKCGYGEHYFKTCVYFGMFERDEPNGHGLAIKDDYSYYKGEFKDKLFHGYGKQYGENYSFEGEFENGSRKKGIFRNDRFQYHGPFRNNLFEGEGTLHFAEGTKYEGLFKNGKPEGKGVMVFSNGKIFQGEFQGGKCLQGKFIRESRIKVLPEEEEGEEEQEREEEEEQGKEEVMEQLSDILDPDSPTDYLLLLFRQARKGKELESTANAKKTNNEGLRTEP